MVERGDLLGLRLVADSAGKGLHARGRAGGGGGLNARVPTVAGGGDGFGLGRVVAHDAVVGLHALALAGRRGGHRSLVPEVLAGGGDDVVAHHLAGFAVALAQADHAAGLHRDGPLLDLMLAAGRAAERVRSLVHARIALRQRRQGQKQGQQQRQRACPTQIFHVCYLLHIPNTFSHVRGLCPTPGIPLA